MGDFKTNLRELRENTGFTQQKVADDLNYNLRTYQEYERGNIGIPQNDIPKIAQYFSCTSDYLFCMTDEMQPQVKEFQEATGLSEKSIAILQAINKKENGSAILDILNKIFENALFYNAIINAHNAKAMTDDINQELTEKTKQFAFNVKLENSFGHMKEVVTTGECYREYLKFKVVAQVKQLFESIIEEGK